MFGDFKNQALFEETENSLPNIIGRSQLQGPVPLTENCRNRPEIIEQIDAFSSHVEGLGITSRFIPGALVEICRELVADSSPVNCNCSIKYS